MSVPYEDYAPAGARPNRAAHAEVKSAKPEPVTDRKAASALYADEPATTRADPIAWNNRAGAWAPKRSAMYDTADNASP